MNYTHRAPAGKFYAIIREVTEHVQLDDTAKLTLEVSDGVHPMQLLLRVNAKAAGRRGAR